MLHIIHYNSSAVIRTYRNLLKKIVTIQVDRLKAVREKRILKPCLAQGPDISAKVRQLCSSVPFSLQPKLLQPDYVSSYKK